MLTANRGRYHNAPDRAKGKQSVWKQLFQNAHSAVCVVHCHNVLLLFSSRGKPADFWGSFGNIWSESHIILTKNKMIYYFYNNLSQIRLFDIVFSIEFIWNRKMLESQPFVCRHTTYKRWRCSQLKPLWTGFRNFMDTIFYVNPMQK